MQVQEAGGGGGGGETGRGGGGDRGRSAASCEEITRDREEWRKACGSRPGPDPVPIPGWECQCWAECGRGLWSMNIDVSPVSHQSRVSLASGLGFLSRSFLSRLGANFWQKW